MPNESQDANVQQYKPADLRETREVVVKETPFSLLAKAGGFEFLEALVIFLISL